MDIKKCINCKYFQKSVAFENGECKCVTSKYYKDIVNYNNNCEQHINIGNIR